MADIKKEVKKTLPFLADHNGTTPLFGTKIRWALDVLKQQPRKNHAGRVGQVVDGSERAS